MESRGANTTVSTLCKH